MEIREIKSPTGRTVFEARFFDMDDGHYVVEEGGSESSAWPWEPYMYAPIVRGMEYWAEIIQPADGAGPASINIGTDSEPNNAFAYSPPGNGGMDSRTLLQRRLQGLPVSPQDQIAGADGVFGLGYADYPRDTVLTQIPMSGKDELMSTAIHELAHALGVASMAGDPNEYEEGEKRFAPAFGPALAGWGPLMVDDHGRPARPNQAILCNGCDNPYDPEAFDARADRSLLVGPNIQDALEGGLPGIPITMYYRDDDGVGVDDNTMSHIELRNSMMSHQSYRNYNGFMEAELAVLQDLGYTIDRRNFFGRSVYGSDMDIVNDRIYAARDAAGSDYITGDYNRSTLGLGLHVYGDRNHVHQVADLLTVGEGGAGIRVDGVGNRITIGPGVRIHANGVAGQGVMFAYGKDHTLVQRGEVEAVGDQGVGLRFDFGSNSLSNALESRGSYIRSVYGRPAALLPELDGPLVRQADITGRVAGQAAAIYISGNAHVERIHIMEGAQIEGHIISDYAGRDQNGAPRLTTLSFGQEADEDGRATGISDPEFAMHYEGNIRGKQNLNLSLDGGFSHLPGQHEVQAVNVQEPAGMLASGRFELAQDGKFTNAGTLVGIPSPTPAMEVIGDFQQTQSGRMVAGFDAQALPSILQVSGTVDLAGTLQLGVTPDWYAGEWSMQTAGPIVATKQRGAFDTIEFLHASPTLTFSAAALGNQQIRLSAERAPEAYSRYARNDNEAAAGRALHQFAAQAPTAAANFYQALDFSRPDGTEVSRVLAQAGPQAYSAGLAASLMRERDVMEHARRGLRTARPDASGSGWHGFAVAFGGQGRQDTKGASVGYDADTYGLVIGGARRLESNPDLSIGLHLDIAEQTHKLKDPQSAKSDATAFGAGAQLQYRAHALEGLYAYSGFRLGVEEASMKRRLGVGDYSASHSADWTGHSASIEGGLGYLHPVNAGMAIGPFMDLNYARVSRPGVSESSTGGTQLDLDSIHADALRSSLGLMLNARHTLQSDATMTVGAKISWHHEWLDRDVTQTARFATTAGPAFDTRNRLLPRNSLGLQTALGWQKDQLSVSAGLGGRVGDGYKAWEGQVSLQWAF